VEGEAIQCLALHPILFEDSNAMPTNPELLLIEEEVTRRFNPSNPITQAIAAKLSKTLYQQRRCEYLINFARSIPTRKIDEMPLEKQAAFKQNVKKLLEKLQTFKRSSRDYSAALQVQSQPATETAADAVTNKANFSGADNV
jgi:hypothetical protein